MRAYFSQFGEISRFRLPRNERVRLLGTLISYPGSVYRNCIKTGRSKHYGFIEFVSVPVAQIVAETMGYYLLMGHILIGHSIRRWATHISNFVEVVHYARLRVGKLLFPRLLSLHQTSLCSASLRLVSRLQEPYQAVIIETGSKRMDLVVLRLRKAMHGYHAPFAVRTHPGLWVNIIFRDDFTRQRSTLLHAGGT
jgi:hypothetical protein